MEYIIEDALEQSEAQALRSEFCDMFNEDISIDDVESLLMDYGLEPDYLESLLF